jgi:anti-sigma factor RsiW
MSQPPQFIGEALRVWHPVRVGVMQEEQIHIVEPKTPKRSLNAPDKARAGQLRCGLSRQEPS